MSADCGGTGARKYDHITPVLHALSVAHLEGDIGPCPLPAKKSVLAIGKNRKTWVAPFV